MIQLNKQELRVKVVRKGSYEEIKCEDVCKAFDTNRLQLK